MSRDPNEYTQCFHVFASTLRRDYVCFDEARKIKIQPYSTAFSFKMLNGEGYDFQFIYQMDTYLSLLRNPSVQLVIDYGLTDHFDEYTFGFKARRAGEDLVVTEALPECALRPGTHIVAANIRGNADFTRVPTMVKQYENGSLWGAEEDREIWEPQLHHMNRYLIRDEQGTRTMPSAVNVDEQGEAVIIPTSRVTVERLPVPPDPAPFELSVDDAGIAILTLRDLDDEAAFATFIEQNRAVLEAAPSLIIDVRTCEGGTEAAIIPLLPYVIAEPTPLARYLEDRCITNYSVGNCERQEAELSYIAEQSDCPAETKGVIDEWKAELSERSGSGLVEEDAPEIEGANEAVRPAGAADHVCLLTDVYTIGAAEVLAEICRDSDRTTTIGRATRGARGFFNPSAVKVAAFGLVFPTSRFTDEGLERHYFRIGVPPEVHVSWTPEFLDRDLDLKAAYTIFNA